jgi:hypothetical protein
MRALGKTPNDPLLRTMSPIQWRICVLNAIEDEKEANKKIYNLTKLAIKMFTATPEGEGEGKEGSVESVGQKVEDDRLDYTENGVRHVRSSEFDKILASGGKYKGFQTEEDVKE